MSHLKLARRDLVRNLSHLRIAHEAKDAERTLAFAVFVGFDCGAIASGTRDRTESLAIAKITEMLRVGHAREAFQYAQSKMDEYGWRAQGAGKHTLNMSGE